MAGYKIERFEEAPRNILGESPHWDIPSQNLYYIDIVGATVHRYNYQDGTFFTASVDNVNVISFILPLVGCANEFAIGIGNKIGIIQWDGISSKANLIRSISTGDDDTIRINDAKADQSGRFYGGTMMREECGDFANARVGKLYKYTKETGFEVLRENIGVSNGLTWNETTNKFYYIDTADVNVKEFDYDPNTGNISNENILIDFKINNKHPGYGPDGLTIDQHGYLYVCFWGGSKIAKINSENGNIEFEIKFPCDKITSCAFGGPELDILYVTSASKRTDLGEYPTAGSLFKVTNLNTKGLKMSNISL